MKEMCTNNEIEQNKVNIKTLLGQDFLNRVFPESLPIPDLVHRTSMGDLPKDKRFFKFYEGGVFEYFDPKRLIDDIDVSFYSVVEVDTKIVALSKLRKDPNKKDNLWATFLSVDPNYQNKGYATKLIEEIFLFAEKSGNSLKFSMFSPEGKQKLEKVVTRCAERSPVQVFYS